MNFLDAATMSALGSAPAVDDVPDVEPLFAGRLSEFDEGGAEAFAISLIREHPRTARQIRKTGIKALLFIVLSASNRAGLRFRVDLRSKMA